MHLRRTGTSIALLACIVGACGPVSGTDPNNPEPNPDGGKVADGGTKDGSIADASPPLTLSEVTFHGEALGLPDVKLDTGLVPKNSLVQLQLKIVAAGETTVDASAYASGSEAAPVLTAIPGSGKVTIKGQYAILSRLVVKLADVPNYDGPFPGIDNFNIEFGNHALFDPYLLDGKSATAKANLNEAELPDIPLPGNIPGNLKITIEKGSSVSAEFKGTCAAIEGTTAAYTGTIKRSGKFVLKLAIEIDVPLTGKASFPLPDVTLPIALPAEPITLKPSKVIFGKTPTKGEEAKIGSCN